MQNKAIHIIHDLIMFITCNSICCFIVQRGSYLSLRPKQQNTQSYSNH